MTAPLRRVPSSSLYPLEPWQISGTDGRERFHLYYAGLYLLDDAGEYAILTAGTRGGSGH